MSEVERKRREAEAKEALKLAKEFKFKPVDVKPSTRHRGRKRR